MAVWGVGLQELTYRSARRAVSLQLECECEFRLQPSAGSAVPCSLRWTGLSADRNSEQKEAPRKRKAMEASRGFSRF